MSTLKLQGILPPFPTPITADGQIDAARLRALCEVLIEAGSGGLVPIGGTGEYTALSPQARQQVVALTVEAAAGRVPVVAGVVSPGFAEAVQAGLDFKAAGADALLLITPFYVTPSQAGIREYFRAYRQAVDLPIVFYDIPYRTGITTTPETIAAMEADGSIIGMKACNPDMSHFNQIANLTSADFQLLAGEDTLFPAQMALGARGGILASAPLLPRHWVQMFELLKDGKMDEAVVAQRQLLPLLEALFSEPNPGPLKAAMKMIGQPCGEVLSPLRAPAEAVVGRLQEALGNLRVQGVLA